VEIVDIFSLIYKNFWFICIVTTFINAAIYKRKAAKYIEKDSSLEEGYNRIARGLVIWGNIPWAVMGIGCVCGKIGNVFEFFRPRDNNPYVLAFFASVIFVWIVGTYWMFIKNGAEILAKHPGLLEKNIPFSKSKEVSNPGEIKILWLIGLAGGIAGMIWLFVMNVPKFNFK
jgi:hypothetical protein